MKFSYVIPSFNTAAWLPHAVKSIQDQTYKDIEIIVVDDCSTDSTPEYLKWLEAQGDKRIKIIRNEKNLGRSATRNIGNKAATGAWICVNDSDDLSVKTRTDWTLKKIQRTGAEVVYGSAVAMDALGNALHEINARPLDIKNALEKRQNGIVHSTMAYKKELADKYPYSEGDICRLGLDDYEMQVRMMVDGVKFECIPDVIAAYRVLETAITSKRDPKEVEACKDKILEGVKCLN